MAFLERLLRPKSIAVIGGGEWCRAVIEQNERIGFDGEIWPVHPKKATLAARRAYASLDEIPAAPDAAFIGVNRHATIDVMARLSAMGAGGAVCFASGFQEATDGARLNEALLRASGDMPFLGPNCYGVINALERVALWPDQHGLSPIGRGVAILAQSSNIAINLTMQRRGLPIALMVTAGNQSRLGLADIALELIEDARITALGLYVESFGDVRAFEALGARSRTLGKPVAVLKAGGSALSQHATLSHTASVAGSSAGAEAFMRRLGLASVSSLTTLIETLKIFHCHGRLAGSRIASLSCSGGEASVMADSATRAGLSFPPLSDEQESTLGGILGGQVSLANPLDYHTDIWRNKAAQTAVFSALGGGGIDLTLVILDFPHPDLCDATDWITTIEAIETASRVRRRPYGVLASLPENMPEDIARRLMEGNIVALCGFESACQAIAAASQPLSGALAPPVLLPPPCENPATLTESQAKHLLAGVGMKVPRAVSGLLAHELGERAPAIGFPVVLKAQGIAHKTQAHGVALNLNSVKELHAAAANMNADRFLLEEMITGAVAELLVGIVRDPAHGLVLTLAAGGILTELVADRQSLLVPSGEDDIRTALEKLRIYAVLSGYRGQARADVNAIIDAIMRLQAFVIAHGAQIAEIEINPLMCTTDRAVVADALVVKGG